MTTTAKTPAAERYRRRATSWARSDLVQIWSEIREGKSIAGWPAGLAFEYLIIRAFDLEGTAVCWPISVRYPPKLPVMEQIDGVVYLGERGFLIESKALTEPAAISALAKLRFRLESRPPSTMGILFSVQDFTLPTETFAQFASPLNVILWSRSDLDKALPGGLMMEGLKQKLRYATERGLPNFPLGDTQ